MSKQTIYRIDKIIKKDLWGLAEVKNYLRVTEDYDDLMIKNMIEDAAQQAENFTKLSLHIRYITVHTFKAESIIQLKHLPVMEILSAKSSVTKDENIRDQVGCLNSGTARLSVRKKFIGSKLDIEYIAGYDEIPKAILGGILLHVSMMYDRTGSSIHMNEELKNIYLPFRRLSLHI